VAVTEVGDISITFLTTNSAVLVYNVGATTVTKSVTRQTFAGNTPSGTYQGGINSLLSACTPSSNNGGQATFLGFLTASINAQNGVALSLNYLLAGGEATCNFNGTYSQLGRYGAITGGQWSCSQNGTQLNVGTYSISNLDIQLTGMTGAFTATDQFCTYTGSIGGIRTTSN
jgi:hypothetical protein